MNPIGPLVILTNYNTFQKFSEGNLQKTYRPFSLTLAKYMTLPLCKRKFRVLKSWYDVKV